MPFFLEDNNNRKWISFIWIQFVHLNSMFLLVLMSILLFLNCLRMLCFEKSLFYYSLAQLVSFQEKSGPCKNYAVIISSLIISTMILDLICQNPTIFKRKKVEKSNLPLQSDFPKGFEGR
jgi:hypothetical protein